MSASSVKSSDTRSAAVFCTDPERLKSWQDVLAGFFVPILPVGGESEAKRLPSNLELDAAFIHSSDHLIHFEDILKGLRIKQRFWFSEVGVFATTSPDLPICKTTKPFAITKADAQEFADYVRGTGNIPACCRALREPGIPLAAAEILDGLAMCDFARQVEGFDGISKVICNETEYSHGCVVIRRLQSLIDDKRPEWKKSTWDEKVPQLGSLISPKDLDEKLKSLAQAARDNKEQEWLSCLKSLRDMLPIGKSGGK